MRLEPTSERLVEEHYQDTAADHLIYLFHVVTYDFSIPYVIGKRVLDYGCGSGYGTYRIAKQCQEVTGVDIAEDAIQYATQTYNADNLSYLTVRPSETEPLPFPDESFDVVLSFQVVEHIRDIGPYLKDIRRLLRPNGVFICATPDRSSRLLPGQKPFNRWHIREYSTENLASELQPFFSNVDVMHMGGKSEVLAIELRRTRRLMWLTLPFTLPFIPEGIRQRALTFLKSLQLRRSKPRSAGPFGFSAADIWINAGASPSVNLVAVARK